MAVDSAQYDTVRNLTPHSMILRGTLEKYGENTTKNENILIHWSVAQSRPRPVQMMKKTGGRKSRWTVPLIQKIDYLSCLVLSRCRAIKCAHYSISSGYFATKSKICLFWDFLEVNELALV